MSLENCLNFVGLLHWNSVEFSTTSLEIKVRMRLVFPKIWKTWVQFLWSLQCFWSNSGNFTANLGANTIENASEMELFIIFPTLENITVEMHSFNHEISGQMTQVSSPMFDIGRLSGGNYFLFLFILFSHMRMSHPQQLRSDVTPHRKQVTMLKVNYCYEHVTLFSHSCHSLYILQTCVTLPLIH